jgi:hypothetical protein
MKPRYYYFIFLAIFLLLVAGYLNSSSNKTKSSISKELKNIERNITKYSFEEKEQKEIAPIKVPTKVKVSKKTDVILKKIISVNKPVVKSTDKISDSIPINNEKKVQLKKLVKIEKRLKPAILNDDVDSNIKEIKNIREALLKNPEVPIWIKDSIKGLKSIKDDYGIDLAFALRGVVQSDLISQQIGSGANLDIVTMYKANENSTVGLKVNIRGQIGKYSSGGFTDAIGSLYSTAPAYGYRDILITEFWYQHLFDNISLKFGIIDPDSFIDNSFYKSSNNYFFNSSVSSAPYASMPNSGLGIALKYKTDNFFITGQLNDADAKVDNSMKHIYEDKLAIYSAIEFGLTPKKNKYYLTLWHKDIGNNSKSAKGMIISLNQTLDENNKIFIKYAVSNDALTQQNLSLGWGKTDLLDKNDIFGIAYSNTKADKDSQAQNNLELFYRYDYYYGIQLTGDIQFIKNPLKSDKNFAVLPGIRVRVVF